MEYRSGKNLEIRVGDVMRMGDDTWAVVEGFEGECVFLTRVFGIKKDQGNGVIRAGERFSARPCEIVHVCAAWDIKVFDSIEHDRVVLPKRIQVGAELYLDVAEEEIEGKLGYIDFDREHIGIKRDQPDVGKMLILLHEIIHYADEANKQYGCYKKGLTEKQVSYLAGMLAGLLMYNDLLVHPFTRDELDAFFVTGE